MCNNNTRTIQIPAGTTDTATQCATWSITVLGFTFTSPSSCASSRTTRDEDTWSCGPAAEGIHGNPRGFQVNVKQFFLENPCPGIPTTLPETLEEANAEVQCLPLPMTNEFKAWSATVKGCSEGSGPAQGLRSLDPPADEIRIHGKGRYVVHRGQIEGLDAAPWTPPLGDQLQVVRTLDPLDLPDALGAVSVLHAPLAGVRDLEATVTYEFFGVPERGTIRNRHRLAGTILGDRRFALVEMRPGSSEDGSSTVSVHDYYFDGSRFAFGQRGAESCNVYLSSSAGAEDALQYEAQFVWPLLGWVQDPFWIPRVPDASYATVTTERLVEFAETFPGIPGLGRTEYAIDVTGEVPHPVRIRYFGPSGHLVRTKDFAGYQELLPGTWRPTSIIDTRLDRRTGEPKFRATVEIHGVLAVSGQEAILPELVRSSDRWLVRLP